LTGRPVRQVAIVEVETVAAVVQAFAEGKIELEKPDAKFNGRDLHYAPSYIAGQKRSGGCIPLAYNAETVGPVSWLDRPKGQVHWTRMRCATHECRCSRC
jgi:hypothetical protein